MKSPSRDAVIAILITASIVTATFVSPASAQSKKEPSRLPWLEGFTLVELETDDVPSMYRAKSLIESHGGQIAILSPPSLLMGWVPLELGDELRGKAGIKNIFFTDVLQGEVAIRDEQTRHMVDYFNRVIRGEYQEDYRLKRLSAPPIDPRQFLSDAKQRGDLEEGEYLDNLTNNGFDVAALKDQGLLLDRSTYAITGNSDRMMGTVAATLIFVESDGSSTDPDTYTWTDQHVQDFVAGANTGMAWWSSRARNYNDCWVAFFVRYIPPTDPRCQQWREMVLHSFGFVSGMAEDIMANFGYSSGNHFTRTTAFNTAQRTTYGTDWSYTGFIAYNPPPAPTALTSGEAAFAYLGGPYTFMLYRSYSWAPEEIFAHESGHIFYACDEYAAGCSSTSCTSVCSNGAVNGNCEDCAQFSRPCMMRHNEWVVCQYTDDHVGWQISPCAPAPLTPPSISGVFPNSGVQGTSFTVTVTGGDFLYGAFADFGADVAVTYSSVPAPDSIQMTVTIENSATIGTRPVTVSNRDLQSALLPNSFSVMPSTRHYVSPTGGDVFPYLTPANAAITVIDGLAAAGDGDTVLVDSTGFALSTIVIEKAVTIEGAWTSGFTARDVIGAKTEIDLSGNIIVNGTGSGFAIDGFVLKNGTGAARGQPTSGFYGGGLMILSSTATIANCEIRSSQSGGGSNFGGGGGVFADNSAVTIDNCWIHDNEASIGGGVYLYDCSAVITDCLIEDNIVSAVSGQPAAAGVALELCSSAALSGNTFDTNTGARDGGGLWIFHSTGVSLAGDTFTHNTASFYGGGVHATRSEVDFDDVTISNNASSVVGGGVALLDTCLATFERCNVMWNTGFFGGGIYFDKGELAVRHNAFVGNDASNSAGALFISGVTAGEVVGNTMDRNGGASNAGGLQSVDSPIEAYNNIITNSTGHGIACSGTLPTLMYNDVWNSSGDDYNGCAAGTGSISLDPIFVDTTVVDYHLGEHSPAIDAGRPGASYEDPDGSRGDMGRFGSHSFAMEQPSYPRNLTAAVQVSDLVLTWDKNPESDLDFYNVYCDTLSGFKPSAGNFVASVLAVDTSTTFPAPPDSAFYVVSAIDVDGYAGGYSGEASTGAATAAGGQVTYHNHLYQNVPNPFNPSTTVRYELRGPGIVSLVVYDVAGRMVKRLVDENKPGGVHTVTWDGTSESGSRVSSGIYFYKLETLNYVQTRKMVLLK